MLQLNAIINVIFMQINITKCIHIFKEISDARTGQQLMPHVTLTAVILLSIVKVQRV